MIAIRRMEDKGYQDRDEGTAEEVCTEVCFRDDADMASQEILGDVEFRSVRE
jgi:hypothetical protein